MAAHLVLKRQKSVQIIFLRDSGRRASFFLRPHSSSITVIFSFVFFKFFFITNLLSSQSNSAFYHSLSIEGLNNARLIALKV
jgi:hypothetical protein